MFLQICFNDCPKRRQLDSPVFFKIQCLASLSQLLGNSHEKTKSEKRCLELKNTHMAFLVVSLLSPYPCLNFTWPLSFYLSWLSFNAVSYRKFPPTPGDQGRFFWYLFWKNTVLYHSHYYSLMIVLIEISVYFTDCEVDDAHCICPSRYYSWHRINI
jgi:hypothetical protein